MAYVDKLLGENERVLVRTRRHRFVLLRAIAPALVLFVCALAALAYLAATGTPATGGWPYWLLALSAGLAVLVGLPGWLRWSSEEYTVTDRRVIHSHGILSKQVLDSSLDKVNDVRLTQSVLGRMFGFGTLEILTASEAGVNRLAWIPDPLAFKRALLDAKGTSVRDRPTAAVDGGIPLPPVAQRLSQLEELRRSGLVTQAEYEAKRAELLSHL